ncbi:MAG: UDP-glucose 4-epimerase GalE [Chitinophagales bacterium]
MAKILITGGCGFIGSHTIVDLINNGFEVISIDNLSRSQASIFDGIEKITGKRVKNFEIDISDEAQLKSIYPELEGIDGIIHFAAYKAVGESVEQPLLYYKNNIGSLINILEASKALKIPHFVFSSSCTVYGNVQKLPVDENTPMGTAESPYGLTKQMGEAIINDFIKAHSDHQSILLRYFNPVGAHSSAFIGELPIGVPSTLVPYITQTAIGIRKELTIFGDDYDTRDGSCIRDYVHVMDIANAHTKALQYMIDGKMSQAIDIFNLGTGNGVSVLEAVESFQKVNNLKLNYKIGPRRSGDVVAVYADNSKAKDVLGWDVKYDLDEMMRSAWEWQKRLSD